MIQAEFMEEVLIDDNMVFDIDNLKGFLNDTIVVQLSRQKSKLFIMN